MGDEESVGRAWAERGLFRPVQRDPSGVTGPTPRAARGPSWRQSSRGRYVPASVARTLPQRILEAAAVLPTYGGVTGWAGLRWQGGTWFDGIGPTGLERPVPLVTGGNIRPQPGILVSHERAQPSDFVAVDGIWVTTSVWSVWFEARHAPGIRAAVRAMDMAAFSDLVSLDELTAFALANPAWTGVPQFRAALALAHENRWSPAEVDLALVWEVEAGLPRPLYNRPIFDLRGRHVATPDLLDPVAGLAVEYDGRNHLSLTRRTKDVGREERLRALGLEYLTVLAPHLAKPATLAQRLAKARSSARFEAESTRAWSVVEPPWWQPTSTVAQRRALNADDRMRLLAHRRAS